MAFCNSCGAVLTEGTKFCNKCGAAVTGGPVAAQPATPTPVPSGGGSSALKIILIVVAVIVVIGIIGIATISFVGYRIAKSSHVRQRGDNVKVETPFGTVETTKDPEQAAKELGIDLYPGAEVQKDGTSSVTLGSIHTVTATFISSDSVDKVCNFYKQKFPGAMVTTSEENHCTIVSNDQKNMVTVDIESHGDGSKLQLTSVTKTK